MSPRAKAPDVTHSHRPDLPVFRVDADCSGCGERRSFTVPEGHDGTHIHWECPCGARNRVDGEDPVKLAQGATPAVVGCEECGAPHALTAPSWVCSACGTENTVLVRRGSETGEATTAHNQPG